MQQVRIFVGREDEIEKLEMQINTWIRSSNIDVRSIQGNIAPQSPTSHPNARPIPSDVLMIITYEVSGEELMRNKPTEYAVAEHELSSAFLGAADGQSC